MRFSVSAIIILAMLLTAFGCSDSSSGSSGGSSGNTDLVGMWNITSYSDEDGVGDYSGWIEFVDDGTFETELLDADNYYTYVISGTWSASSTNLTTVIEESNDLWMPEGTYTWNYTINNNTLAMDITVDGDHIEMTFIEDTSNETGSLTGIVSEAARDGIEGVLVSVVNSGKTATTASDGSYTVSGIPIGAYDVTFSKSGWVTVTEPGIQIVKDQSTNLDVQMQQGSSGVGSMEGYVMDASNLVALAGATIELDGTSLSTTSDANGYYLLSNIPAGDYLAVCSKTGYNTSDTYVSITDGEETTTDFTMIEEGNEPYAILSGNITCAGHGTPINNVVITVGEVGGGITDENGDYEAMVLGEGTYDVTFYKLGFEPYTETGVTFTIGETVDLDVQLTMYEETTTNNFQVFVSKDDLTPIQGATVTLEGTSYTGTTNLLGLCTFNDVPVGPYQISVTKTGYQSITGRYVYVYSYQSTPAAVNITLEPSR